MTSAQEKNILLYIEKAPVADILRIKEQYPKYRFALLFTAGSHGEKLMNKFREVFDILLPCDFNSSKSIIETLTPYHNQLLAVTCRGEAKIPSFMKMIPYVPYLRTPSTESLDWATNKIKMRSRFKAFNRAITPKFRIVRDTSTKTIEQIDKSVGFPLVIKPAGLAQSLLVSICYHKEELEAVLKKTFKKINSLLREYKGESTGPVVLAEQFMEGDMYSIDGHITSRGKMYFYPPVQVITGRDIGFDDFFGYKRITPTNLSPKSIDGMHAVTQDAVHALGLRSSTFHAELMKTEKGWKMIEIAPRIGGYRVDMHQLSYGVDESINDILIRIPKKPILRNRALQHTAVMMFFAMREGVITKLSGTKKAQSLESFHEIKINKKVGDKAFFAKNGGKSVLTITLTNKMRSDLLADIRRLEKMIDIRTEKHNPRMTNE